MALLLALLLQAMACSLVVDFPTPREETADAGTSARVERDAARDSGREAGPVGNDAQTMTACAPFTNVGCSSSQLCCDLQDGNGPVCAATLGSAQCTACGIACSDEKAPNCGGRTCECEAGSGKACADGQRCMNDGSTPRCVQCMTDADCSGRPDNLKQCVDNKCVECDRGTLENDPSDDQGCTPTTPICNSTHGCTGCSISPNNCPNGMQCNPGLGCSGCRLNVPVSQNGCGGTSPVCDTVTLGGTPVQQCRKCNTNAECSGGFCLNATGECVNGCDPDEAPLTNGCAAVTPICKMAATGFSCTVCSSPSDCSKLPATPLCATEGTLSGQCVQCRNNTDCSADGTGATPVCSLAGQCRARTAADCTGVTPKFEPTTKKCVACLPASQTTDCAGTVAGPLCSPKTFTCGQCIDDTACMQIPATPVCDLMTNKCVAGCKTDAQCGTGTPHCDTANGGVCVACTADAQCTTTAAPICSPTTKTCVPCTSLVPATDANSACSHKDRLKPICITMNPAKAGQCAACDGSMGCAPPVGVCDATNSCVTCNVTTNAGCTDPAKPVCLPIAAPGTGTGCFVCDPSKAPGLNGCPVLSTCVAYVCRPVVPSLDGGV